ncbi:MAG: helix-turn-helix transcriptional regulator [Candidatus Schekmanbacteria bacterium]|nr:helix-turn-helix transcriptional regulator [Candidatus Schekmanbacteria bacterium]
MANQYKSFGEFLKSLRKKKRITLREFCLKALADPANISRLERDTMPPPQDPDILERYAKALGIDVGSDDWYTFVDLASIARGIIPKDLISDAEVVNLLPVFFRTLRGQKPTKEEMRKLADKIKKS